MEADFATMVAPVDFPVMPENPSEEYRLGLRDGQRMVLHSIQRNRDHWRRLLGVPAEGAASVLARLYAKGAGEDNDPATVIQRATRTVADSADLYLIPPSNILEPPKRSEPASVSGPPSPAPTTQEVSDDPAG